MGDEPGGWLGHHPRRRAWAPVPPPRSGQRGHLTPREAGEHARAAAVKAVLLTHMSDEMDELWARREAEAAFGGPVHIAHEGAVFNS